MPELEFGQKIEVSGKSVSGFSVNHVQVENSESDQREDSVGESSGGCSSDTVCVSVVISVGASSCSSGDSRNPAEGILPTRKTLIGAGPSRPTEWPTKPSQFALVLELGQQNSKVTDSRQAVHDWLGAGHPGAGARHADGARAFSHWDLQAAERGACRTGRRQTGLGSRERLHAVVEAGFGGAWNASWGAALGWSGDAHTARHGGAEAVEKLGADPSGWPVPGAAYEDRQVLAELLDRHGRGEADGWPGAGRWGGGRDQNSDASAEVYSRATAYEIGTKNRSENTSEIRAKIGLLNRPVGRTGDIGIREAQLRPDVAPAIDGVPICPVAGHAAIAGGHSKDRSGWAIGERRPGDAAGGAELVRLTDFCRSISASPSIDRATFAVRLAAGLASGASKAAVDSYGWGEISAKNSCRVLSDLAAVCLMACENVSSAEPADKYIRSAASLRAIAANRARDLDRGRFGQPAYGFTCRAKSVCTFGPVGESRCALWPIWPQSGDVSQNLCRGNYRRDRCRKIAGRASIRKAEGVGISSLCAESHWLAAVNCVPDVEFLDFYEAAPISGKLRAMGPTFADIRKAEHSGISSLNAESCYAAGVSSPTSQIGFFEALKWPDFFRPWLGPQKHIRRGELFSTPSLFVESRCAAIIFARDRWRSIFEALKWRLFFVRFGACEKHIRRGEVFDTSCPNAQRACFAGSRSVPDQTDRKFFIFSEFSGILLDSFAAPKDIRRAELFGTFCPGVSRQFSSESACDDSFAGAISAVNSGECLTEINVQKLPDFSKVISRAPSSESITGINVATSPDLVIPDLSESINGISAQASPEFARFNSGEAFTGINARVCDSPFEQTRLADSSIRAFLVRTGSLRACACLKARAPP